MQCPTCWISSRALRGSIAFAIAALTGAQAQQHLPKRLPANYRGAEAVAALGDDLPAVARAHGLAPIVLTALFKNQQGLAVDRDGSLLFICDAMPLAAESVVANSATAVATADSTDALRLHSFPGAQRVIYLDFNGHTTAGTQWNNAFTGGAPIVSQPFDLDGSPSTFGAAEQTLIRRIWQRVADDYAPFAIDVTTEDPGLEALRRTSSTDLAFGVRVVISPTNWYNTGAGGVGYLGSFSWNSDTPCYAFTAQLANGEKYIAESASHEAGHTLGLYHDGVGGSAPSGYYAGQGSWAPLMGVGYYKPVTQFSRGEYANANNTQDDFAVISGHAPFATDDHGNTLTTASALAGPTVSDGGTIERGTDVDLFRFATSGGSLSLNVRGPAPEPNLDIVAELLNTSGGVVQASNPSGLDAALSAVLPAGTYYVRISGTGAGDPLTTGYSAYGSVGNYVITGSLPPVTVTPQPPPPPAPLLAPTGLSAAAVSSTRVDLKWTDNSSDETQFTVERSTDNVNFGPAAALGANSISFADTRVVAGTTYYYRVSARRSDEVSAFTNTASATPPVAPVASGAWRSQDVGAVGVPGSAIESGASVQLAGSGADIWETADAFRFRHQPWTGDGELVVRVSSLTYTDAWAKAGVMFRESLDAGSRNVFIAVTPANGVAFQHRSATNAGSTYTGGSRAVAPRWLKLTRTGDTFTGYESADGSAWAQVGSVTLPLPATVQVGLAVTSHNNATLATAGFDNIALAAGSAPPPPPPTSTWSQGDIGGVALAGSSEINGSTITVRGSGADIWETADGFRFVYRAMTGDCEVRAQVASLTNTNPWAKAGVMIRESTAANARNAFACVTAMNGSGAQARTATGAATSYTSGPWVSAPHWVRLVRAGNRITASTSFDGVNWTQGASQDVIMGATVLVGFAVTSHDNTQLNTAVFNNAVVQ